jgi:hypothetical protein
LCPDQDRCNFSIFQINTQLQQKLCQSEYSNLFPFPPNLGGRVPS